MHRRLFNLFTSVALLLCLLLISLWMGSYWRVMGVTVLTRGELADKRAQLISHSATAVRGQFSIARQTTTFTKPWSNPPKPIQRLSFSSVPPGPVTRIPAGPLGFAWGNRQNPANGFASRRLTFPAWAALPPLLVLPALNLASFLRHRRQRDRIARGLCSACGYDLRGSSDRCPECGKPIRGRITTTVEPSSTAPDTAIA